MAKVKIIPLEPKKIIKRFDRGQKVVDVDRGQKVVNAARLPSVPVPPPPPPKGKAK